MNPPKKIKGLRWYVVSMLFMATGLNYLDRQTLSVLAGTIKAELGISAVEYSYITSAFLISYMIMYAVSGRLVDRLGTRRAFTIFVTAWSIASALHALARTALQFTVCRFLLGATEPANFPAAVKTCSAWFPMRERALAVGLFNSGSALGAAVAAPLVSLVALTWGWQSAFVLGGLLGLVWVVVWSLTYRLPREHPWLTTEELTLIEGDSPPPAIPVAPPTVRRLLGMRETWGCILARALTDPISYFFIFWTPLFLQQERGFDLADLGKYSWIPFVALAFGNVAGGGIPQFLARYNWTTDRARKTVMGIASLMIPSCCLLIPSVPHAAGAIALISVAMFSHAAWANMTLPAEVFPQNAVGSVSGFGGAAGALVGAVATVAVGWTVEKFSFTPVFGAIAFLPLTAFVLVCLLVKNLGRTREIPA
ncbi:MAG TPA: MFS transporter [Lacunisphaera sp.]|nr:MFS transporter [Lacunisphaera sp.]